MVKDNVCPICLGELDGYYIEEGHIIYADKRLTCKNCGFSFQGTFDESLVDID